MVQPGSRQSRGQRWGSSLLCFCSQVPPSRTLGAPWGKHSVREPGVHVHHEHKTQTPITATQSHGARALTPIDAHTHTHHGARALTHTRVHTTGQGHSHTLMHTPWGKGTHTHACTYHRARALTLIDAHATGQGHSHTHVHMCTRHGAMRYAWSQGTRPPPLPFSLGKISLNFQFF